MMQTIANRWSVAALFVTLIGGSAIAEIKPGQPATDIHLQQLNQAMDRPVDVLIRTTSHNYDSLRLAVQEAGGQVKQTFKYVRGLSASVPAGAVAKLQRHPGVLGVSADEIRRPTAVDISAMAAHYDNSAKDARFAQQLPGIVAMGGDPADVNDLDQLIAQGTAFDLGSKFELGERINFTQAQLAVLAEEMSPQQYANPVAQNALPIWRSGNFGQGSKVAVIDSGVYADHFLLAGRVTECVDLSSDVGGPDENCSSPANNFHGTHVASTIAGNGATLVRANSPIAKAIARHLAPLANASSLGFPGGKILPLNGIAPLADIYGVKVFPASGGGAATSTIIGAIEHVIDAHLGGNDIDVINMSLGGPTTYDGVDMEDQAVDAATAAGITVVTSAGNAGPSTHTVGSPATAQSSISVAAMAHPDHMRTFWDFNFFPSNSGHQLFVSDQPQLAYFSSRGGTADGRANPQISAPGTFILAALISEADPNGIGFSSGTSMAAPGIAGTVALLNTVSEAAGLGASPYDYLQALQAGAEPMVGYGAFEQGAGANNASAALQALLSDANLGEAFPPLPAPDPASPVTPDGINLGIGSGGSQVIDIKNLQPGENRHYYVQTDRNTNLIAMDVSKVRTKRNPFKINSFEVYVKSGTRTYEHYYANSVNVFGDARLQVEDRASSASGAVSGVILENALIQPGYTRITIENDWTSSGPMSGRFEVSVEANGNETAPVIIPGAIAEGDPSLGYLFPCAVLSCRLDLAWPNDWSVYPTTDLDLTIVGLDAGFNAVMLDVGGASLNAPESSLGALIPLVDGATAEDVVFVVAFVDGYATHGRLEDFVLSFWP